MDASNFAPGDENTDEIINYAKIHDTINEIINYANIQFYLVTLPCLVSHNCNGEQIGKQSLTSIIAHNI